MWLCIWPSNSIYLICADIEHHKDYICESFPSSFSLVSQWKTMTFFSLWRWTLHKSRAALCSGLVEHEHALVSAAVLGVCCIDALLPYRVPINPFSCVMCAKICVGQFGPWWQPNQLLLPFALLHDLHVLYMDLPVWSFAVQSISAIISSRCKGQRRKCSGTTCLSLPATPLGCDLTSTILSFENSMNF